MPASPLLAVRRPGRPAHTLSIVRRETLRWFDHGRRAARGLADRAVAAGVLAMGDQAVELVPSADEPAGAARTLEAHKGAREALAAAALMGFRERVYDHAQAAMLAAMFPAWASVRAVREARGPDARLYDAAEVLARERAPEPLVPVTDAAIAGWIDTAFAAGVASVVHLRLVTLREATRRAEARTAA